MVVALGVISFDAVSLSCLLRFSLLRGWWDSDTDCESCRNRLPRPSSSTTHLCLRLLGDERRVRLFWAAKGSWRDVGEMKLMAGM